MKKYLIPIVLIGCIGTAGAATVKCIAFQPSVKCEYENPGDYPIFTATCSGVAVKGLGYCSTQSGGSIGTTSLTLNKGPGAYCWCKMISPAVSYWVYLEQANDTGQCWHTCSIDCAVRLGNSRDSIIRNSLFNNLDI